jgi:hypothetical protein
MANVNVGLMGEVEALVFPAETVGHYLALDANPEYGPFPLMAMADMAARLDGFMRNWDKNEIVVLPTEDLWAILRSTSAMTERFCNELCWAKAELRRRGYALA